MVAALLNVIYFLDGSAALTFFRSGLRSLPPANYIVQIELTQMNIELQLKKVPGNSELWI